MRNLLMLVAIATLASVTLAACHSEPPPLPVGHPARDDAAEAPARPSITPFDQDPTAPQTQPATTRGGRE